MSTIVVHQGGRRSIVRPLLIFGGLAVLSVSIAAGRGIPVAAGFCLFTSVLALFARQLSRWHALLGTVVVIVLIVPIKRYKIAVNLPFDLELYRVVLAGVLALWGGSLLADRRIRLRRTFLDGPLLLFAFAVVGSVLTNTSRITAQDADAATARARWGVIFPDLTNNVAKAVLFLISFFLVYYFIVSVVRDSYSVHAVLKVLVAGATFVAIFSIVERRAGYNLFDHLGNLVPLSVYQGDPDILARGGGANRVYASAQSPIALAGLFVMVLPLAVYIAKKTKRLGWAAAAVVIAFGAASAVSRTSVTMLVTVLLVLVLCRKLDLRRVAVFALPVLLAVHFAVPGAIGGLRAAFFPRGGIVASESAYGGRVSGRRLNPQFEQIAAKPVFGVGYGTRITTGPEQNALILDNEWLGTTEDTGLVGFVAWLWFFIRFIRRAGREAKRDQTLRGWLLAAQTAAITAFAVGMLTYDAFSFIQVTFVMFVLAGLTAVTLRYLEPSIDTSR